MLYELILKSLNIKKYVYLLEPLILLFTSSLALYSLIFPLYLSYPSFRSVKLLKRWIRVETTLDYLFFCLKFSRGAPSVGLFPRLFVLAFLFFLFFLDWKYCGAVGGKHLIKKVWLTPQFYPFSSLTLLED